MKKAQATLEFTLIFIVSTALLLGLLGLWKWSSDNIVKRQLDYNAQREKAGHKAKVASSLGPLPEVTATLSEAQAFLDAMQGEGGSFGLLSPEQRSAYLENANEAIAGIQEMLTTLTGYRDTWQDGLEDAQGKKDVSRQKIDALEVELAAARAHQPRLELIGWDPVTGEPVYKNWDLEVQRIEVEIGKETNGYYTYPFAEPPTYDYSNSRWMSEFSTREAWAEDYWNYTVYGASEGNDVHHLYVNYTPGLLDWQAREGYAQEQYDLFQSYVDDATDSLNEIVAIRDQLQQAQDG